MIVANLVTEMTDGTGGINCAETLDEMLTFVKNEGEYEGSGNSHDDRVMSFAIGKFVRTRLKLPMMQKATPLGGWEPKTPERKAPNMNAWV